MNIFYLDHDPVVAAKWMVDKHVVKMILESAQLLSTAHRVLDGTEKVVQRYVAGSFPARYRNVKQWVLEDGRDNVIYQATHINHPSAVWIRESVLNYAWLVDHMYALMQEYSYRYSTDTIQKTHKCSGEIFYQLSSPPKNLSNFPMTPIPSCMDEQYRVSDDPVDNYRNYYKFGKADLHKWTKRDRPFWLIE
jgi:hypothetical protein